MPNSDQPPKPPNAAAQALLEDLTAIEAELHALRLRADASAAATFRAATVTESARRALCTNQHIDALGLVRALTAVELEADALGHTRDNLTALLRQLPVGMISI